SAAAEKLARGTAEQKQTQAEEAEADTRAFADFLADYVLAATRPEGIQAGVGVNVTMAEALEKAEPKIAEVFAGRPKAEATTRHALGVTWRTLGRYREAEKQLRRALELREHFLGPDAVPTLITRNSLGVTLSESGQPLLAVPLLQQTLAALKVQLGPD